MDDVRYALHALPLIFSETRMQRFVFVAESAFLTKSGWRVAHEILSTSEPELTFFDVESIAAFDGDIGNGPSTECFGWSTSAFIWWEKNAPGFFGGCYGDNGLTAATAAQKRCAHGAIRTKQFTWDAIADAINAVAFG